MNSTISGGQDNAATGFYATVSGGGNNIASNTRATISGGGSNTASGHYSTVSGGSHNTASNLYSTVSGGNDNTASGNISHAAGFYAHANHDGAFVWGSSTSDSTASFNPYTFTARCANGARFYTAQTGTATGVSLPAGGGAWANLCDANQKNFHGEVNTTEILRRVVALPMHRWSYKTQDESIKHIGPTAQDFYAAFGLGDNNTTISTIDPDGVALAAIQELAKQNEELKKTTTQQSAEIAELKQLVEQMIQLGHK
ncbi:MAG: hypothetical protein IPP40_14310 [bacterium]|nr:hypothetical protein [bacterium]